MRQNEAELGTIYGSFQGAGVSKTRVNVSFMKVHLKFPINFSVLGPPFPSQLPQSTGGAFEIRERNYE